MAKESLRVVESRNIRFYVSDLYAQKFNAVVSGEEFSDRYNRDYFNVMDEQEHASKINALPSDVQAEHDKLNQSNLVIFHFPFWWWSVPAIMKGWFDRVLSRGYAYGDSGMLCDKKALLVITAETKRARFSEVARRSHDVLYSIEEGVLRYVGFKVVPAFVAAEIYTISDEERNAYKNDYRNYLQTVLDQI